MGSRDLSRGGNIWRDFLCSVLVTVNEELIRGVPMLTYKSLLSLCVVFFVRV